MVLNGPERSISNTPHSNENKAAALWFPSTVANIVLMVWDCRIAVPYPQKNTFRVSKWCFTQWITNVFLPSHLLKQQDQGRGDLTTSATGKQCSIASNHKRGRHHLFYPQEWNIRACSDDRLDVNRFITMAARFRRGICSTDLKTNTSDKFHAEQSKSRGTQISSGLNQLVFYNSHKATGCLWYAPLTAIHYINMPGFYMHVYYLSRSLFWSSNLDLYHRGRQIKGSEWQCSVSSWPVGGNTCILSGWGRAKQIYCSQKQEEGLGQTQVVSIGDKCFFFLFF